MNDDQQSTTTPKSTTEAISTPSRRRWYRLHWSTWIVIGMALAIVAIVEVPGRPNSGGHFIGYTQVFSEHGWPFVFLYRDASPPQLPAEVKIGSEQIKRLHDEKILPRADMPNYYFGLGEDVLGEPRWLDASNWSFKGETCIFWIALTLDIAVAIAFVACIATAYEFWSQSRWHYSLRFLLCGFVLVAIFLAWWRAAINGWERESRAVTKLRNKGFLIVVQCDAPILLRILVGANHLHPFNHVVMIYSANHNYADIQLGKNVNTCPINEADFEYLKDLPHLQRLEIDGPQITDESLQLLSGLANLRLLYLDNSKVSDAGLEYIHDIPELRCLSLDGTNITGAGFRHFKGMPLLLELTLENTAVTDDALPYLKSFPQIENLSLKCSQVTDLGMTHLKELTSLKTLRLEDTKITDAGLLQLEGADQLEFLDINGTKVTEEGVKKLRRALPKCYIDDEQHYSTTSDDPFN